MGERADGRNSVWRKCGVSPSSLSRSNLPLSFQLFCHLQQLGDGVPVSACSGFLQGLVDCWPQLRLSHTVRKINVKLAAIDPHFLSAGSDLENLIPSLPVRLCGEEG